MGFIFILRLGLGRRKNGSCEDESIEAEAEVDHEVFCNEFAISMTL